MTTGEVIGLLSEILGVIAVTMLMTLNPRFKQHPPLVFRYPHREAVAATVVAAGLLAIGFVIFLSTAPAPNSGALSTTPALATLRQQLWAAAAGVLLVVIALIYRRQPLRSAGWNRPLLMPALQTGIAIILLVLFLRGKFAMLLDGISPAESSALLFIVLISLAEETVFRGYLQPRLSARLGNTPGWLLTSALFAVWQIPRLMHQPTASLAIGVGLGLVQGLLAGWMMQKCRHVLAPSLYRIVSAWMPFLV